MCLYQIRPWLVHQIIISSMYLPAELSHDELFFGHEHVLLLGKHVDTHIVPCSISEVLQLYIGTVIGLKFCILTLDKISICFHDTSMKMNLLILIHKFELNVFRQQAYR